MACQKGGEGGREDDREGWSREGREEGREGGGYAQRVREEEGGRGREGGREGGTYHAGQRIGLYDELRHLGALPAAGCASMTYNCH